MKDSGIEWIGKVPIDWQNRRIGNYFNQVKDKNIDMQERNLLSLSYGSIIRRNINSSEGLLPKSFSTYNIVRGGDIVLRMTDLQNDQTSLRTGYVNEQGIITSAYITIRPKDINKVNSKYIQLLLHSFDVNKGFYGMGSGVRQNVTFNDIKKLPVMLPFKEIQDKIVDKLESNLKNINNIIAATKQSIKELRKYKQSIITEVVTKGLDSNIKMKDSGIEWIGQIPSHWEINKIKFVTEVDEEKKDFNKGDVYIGLENVISYSGKLNGYSKLPIDSKENSFNKGDVLYSKLRPYLAKSFIAETDGSCSGEFIVFRHYEGEKKYLLYWLISQLFTDFINATSYGAKMPRSSWEYIKETSIPQPPKEEETLIVYYLEEVTSQIDKLILEKEKVIKELEFYKNSLIYEYVTGKKEV